MTASSIQVLNTSHIDSLLPLRQRAKRWSASSPQDGPRTLTAMIITASRTFLFCLPVHFPRHEIPLRRGNESSRDVSVSRVAGAAPSPRHESLDMVQTRPRTTLGFTLKSRNFPEWMNYLTREISNPLPHHHLLKSKDLYTDGKTFVFT